MKHKKTPWSWHLGEDYIELYSSKDESVFGEIMCSPQYIIKDAEFVLRAVNNHESLLKALKNLVYRMDMNADLNEYKKDGSITRLTEAREAIKQAEIS